MKFVWFTLASMTLLSGCVGPMIENLSMKGEPISRLEQLHGPPSEQAQSSSGRNYVWVRHADTGGECRMRVTTDEVGRVTDVKMIGRMKDCRDLRHPERGASR